MGKGRDRKNIAYVIERASRSAKCHELQRGVCAFRDETRWDGDLGEAEVAGAYGALEVRCEGYVEGFDGVANSEVDLWFVLSA
jgi:hypothetical protein